MDRVRIADLVIGIGLVSVLVGGCAPAARPGTHASPKQARATGQPYRIAPRDELKIVVMGHPDLTTTQTVGADGVVQAPLIGSIPAAGSTETELARAVEAGLADGYLKRPQVTVAVAAYGESIYVVGEVARPGAYAFQPELTVLKVLALAGGETARAALGRVKVLRPRAQGGMETVAVEPWDVLRPDDVVVVPERVF